MCTQVSSGRFPGWPVFESDECGAALRVLQSGKVNYWTGNECREFEREWTASVGARNALALANGSVALDAALQALNVGPGADVIVSPRSFAASAMCAINAGARPVFADVCRESGNMTAATMENARTPATRAAIVVHLGGWPCDMDSIMAWGKQHSISIVEDCAQAHGATIGGKPIGSFGDAASWSFCQDKIITTGGEGGMLSFRDSAAWKRAWSIAQHGKDYDLANAPHASESFRWLVSTTGTNLRMTEMQAAIGRAQLRKLPQWHRARARNASIMQHELSALPFLRVPEAPEGHAWYRFYAYARPESGVGRDALISAVRAAGWPAFEGTCPEIYRERIFRDRGYAPAQPLPAAKELGETGMAFLVHPTIDEDQMHAYARGVASAMESVAGAASVAGAVSSASAAVSAGGRS